jgi:hypothetical protein
MVGSSWRLLWGWFYKEERRGKGTTEDMEDEEPVNTQRVKKEKRIGQG